MINTRGLELQVGDLVTSVDGVSDDFLSENLPWLITSVSAQTFNTDKIFFIDCRGNRCHRLADFVTVYDLLRKRR